MNPIAKNPLLSVSPLKHGAIPFQEIKKEQFLPSLKTAIEEARQSIEKIKQTERPDFFNTIEALEVSGEKVDFIGRLFYNLLSAHSDDEMEKLALEMGPVLSNFSNDVMLDGDLFARIKLVNERASQLNLNTEQRQLLENTYKDFVRNGALLNEEQKGRLRELDQELSKLGPQFFQNVSKATYAFELWIDNEAQLKGLPTSSIEAAAKAASEKGKEGQWLFTLEAPSLIPFLTYAEDRSLREQVWLAQNSRCLGGTYDNQENILKIVRLRHQRAQLLGYKNHADFVLEKRMAQSPDMVRSFLNRLLSKLKPAAEKDLKDLTEYSISVGGPEELKPWDLNYYAEKLKQHKYAINEEELRPYFPLNQVIDGVFEHARRLYGLVFKANPEYPTYHPDVKVYEVHDEQTGDFVGLFYADFFPRPSKKGGAWMTNFYEQGLYQGKVIRPHVSIVCNFTKPVGDKPSLLTHSEVSTLFHEFGHSLHSLLSQCHYRSLSGTNVYWDFVELPSQIMENWVVEKESLDLFAKHYQTGEKLPAETAEKIKASARFLAGWFGLRQLNLGLLDMAWHSHVNPDTISSVPDFEQEALEATSLMPTIPGTRISTSFSHIFAGGYSAGYYSYKWAEALDADAFEAFREKGLFDSDTAKSFKDNVLSKGGSEHPMSLYKRFRGREPDPDALLRRDGFL